MTRRIDRTYNVDTQSRDRVRFRDHRQPWCSALSGSQPTARTKRVLQEKPNRPVAEDDGVRPTALRNGSSYAFARENNLPYCGGYRGADALTDLPTCGALIMKTRPQARGAQVAGQCEILH